MYDLTGFQRDLLTVIAGKDDPYGLAIKRAVEEYYGSDVNHGRLYPNLDQLVQKGLVEKGTIDKRTNYYRVTRRGKRALSDRREWEEGQLGDVELPEPTDTRESGGAEA